MKKTILSVLISLGFISLAQAGEGNIDTKTTATMQATCSISADTIGFGAVATPLMMQSAQSDMTVKCSNASPYTVELAYGGIYGSGTYSDYSVGYDAKSNDWVRYNVYNNSGVVLGTIICGYTSTAKGQVIFSTLAAATAYGYNKVNTWTNGANACTTNGTLAGTTPKGWQGAFDASEKQSVGGGGYTFGVMNGMSKGDKLAYSIQVPGDANKVWNSGANSYKSTGNGDNQTIPLVAKIVPDKSGSKYPAPDMYLDTVTAVISY